MKLPSPLNRAMIARVSNELAQKSKTAEIALPDSKGGETPKQLQTYRTDIYTYFTESTSETQLLYSAENWVKIKLALQTAGPVAVGTIASLAPVLSGHGILLDPDAEPFEAFLPKGTRFYITSETVNRISVTIEPVPWLEQIDLDNIASQNGTRNAVISIGRDIVNALGNLLQGKVPEPAAARVTTPALMPGRAPPPPTIGRIPTLPLLGRIPRLTGLRRR